MLTLTLYSRADCPLCDKMKAELALAAPELGFVVQEVDIGGNPDLEERYGQSIPVLAHRDRALFKGRLTREDLARKLERINREGKA